MNDLVLVDTSAWIEFFRRGNSPVAEIVDRLLSEDLVATVGVIKAEIWQGARTEQEFRRLELMLGALTLLKDPPDLWKRVGELGFRLRRAGHTGIGIPDLLIAVAAQHWKIAILTLDRHFEAISAVVPTQLL